MCLLPPLVFAVIWVLAFVQTRSPLLSTGISLGAVIVLILAAYFVWRKWWRKEEEEKPKRR